MKKMAMVLIFVFALAGLVSGCAEPGAVKRSGSLTTREEPTKSTTAKKKSRSKLETPDTSAGLLSKRKDPSTTQRVPSHVGTGQPTVVSPPSGLYSLDAVVDFDTLDEVTFHPARGTLSMSGHRIRSDRKGDVHYLTILAEALESEKPMFSLEWTPSSKREVDRAFAYFSDDRNNEEITTKLSGIFDANGRLNRKGASLFKALGADVREGMDRYEFNASLLTAAGHQRAGTVLKAFGAMVEAIKRNDKASRNRSIEELVTALGLYDFVAHHASRYRAGQITENQLFDTVYPRILDELANAFGWNGARFVEKYKGLRRAGRSYEYAGDEALWDFQNELNTLPRKMIDTLTARVSEVLVPPDIMKEVLDAELWVQPILHGIPGGSQLARVAFEADVFCKSLFNMPNLKSKVPKYQTYFEWRRMKRRQPVPEHGHLWASPGDFELFVATDGQTLRFGRTPMRINIEKYLPGRISAPDPQLNEYAGLLTDCYDDMAREHPILHQLRESTKMVAVAHWLKKQGFALSMPLAGRERVNLPAAVPGIIYMVMAIKPGSVGEILTAAGGVDFCGDRGWRYAPRDIQATQSDFVESTVRQTREKVERIFSKKIDAPVPQPLGWVTTKAYGGGRITTVTISTVSSASSTTSVRLRQSPEEQAAFLWKGDDLEGAERAYRKLVDSCSGDERYCASLRLILAQVLHDKGDDGEAIKEVKEAVRVAPGLPLARLMLAKALSDQGDFNGAQKVLEEYLSLDPGNKAAEKILLNLKARQRKPAPVTSTPLPSVPLEPYNQAIARVSTGELETSSERMKKDSELVDKRIEERLRLSGDRPPRIPKKLAETKRWKEFQSKDDKLNKDYQEIDRKLEEIRARRDSGAGNQKELEKQELQLKQEQAAVKEKIEVLGEEMVSVIVEWEKENPEPSLPPNQGAPPETQKP